MVFECATGGQGGLAGLCEGLRTADGLEPVKAVSPMESWGQPSSSSSNASEWTRGCYARTGRNRGGYQGGGSFVYRRTGSNASVEKAAGVRQTVAALAGVQSCRESFLSGARVE